MFVVSWNAPGACVYRKTIEATVMGVPPLNPSHCYVIARAGSADEVERRAFEVRDFTVSPTRTSVLLIGHAYDPPGGVYPGP
jgi:hypothetical protein